MAILMLQPFAILPMWVLYALTAIAMLAVGLTYCSEWRTSARLSRGVVVAAVVGLFIIVGFDCGGWVPDWLCFMI